MPIQLVTTFDYSALERALAGVRVRSVEAARKAPLKTAKAFVRRVVEVTPPGSAGRTGLAARRQGERRIDADLRGIFVPTILRGRRPEQHPDVEAIYDAIMGARKGRGGPRLGKKYFVDARKLALLRAKLYGRVGFLAGGWNAAARILGVRLPAWITRHGEEHGAGQIIVDPDGIRILLSNAVQYNADVDGYPRRVQAALDYVAAGIVRETEHLLALELGRVR